MAAWELLGKSAYEMGIVGGRRGYWMPRSEILFGVGVIAICIVSVSVSVVVLKSRVVGKYDGSCSFLFYLLLLLFMCLLLMSVPRPMNYFRVFKER